MIVPVMPHAERLFRVVVILYEKSRDLSGLRLYADLSRFSLRDLFSVGIQQNDGEEGIGFAHGARLGGDPDPGSQKHRGFRLPESLMDHLSGKIGETVHHFRIEGLSRHPHVFESGEIVMGEILPDEEAEHGGRRAEGGDAVLLEKRQDLRGMEAVEIVDEDRPFAQPLPEEFPPHGLGPARIGNGEMQSVGIHLLPPVGGHDMPQRIGVDMDDALGEARGAGTEEDEERIGGLV